MIKIQRLTFHGATAAALAAAAQPAQQGRIPGCVTAKLTGAHGPVHACPGDMGKRKPVSLIAKQKTFFRLDRDPPDRAGRE